MTSISETHKLPKKLNVKKSEDRISNLPCSLISHILSFLPTKHAVATCVLSTKWKQCWTSIDSVVLDDKLLLNPQKGDRTPPLQVSFQSFVHQVLLLRQTSCLYKFHLKCSQSHDFSHVNTWVASALLSNVQELCLSIPMEHSPELPQDFFSCRTIVILKLGRKFVMNAPTVVYLPSLKILHLDKVKFLDDDSIKRLICGCPVLEELSMRECVGQDVHIVNIVAPVLRRLALNFLTYDYWKTTEFPEYKIVLDTPALLYLEINDCIAEGYSVKNLCHLVEAHIGIVQCLDQLESNYSEAITDLLKGISNVQHLYLSGSFMEAIRYNGPQLPKLQNMTYLELGGIDDDSVICALLSELLEDSSLLGTLVFKQVHSYGAFDGRRSVELKTEDYFLNKEKVLEKVSVDYPSSTRNWTIHITQ